MDKIRSSKNFVRSSKNFVRSSKNFVRSSKSGEKQNFIYGKTYK